MERIIYESYVDLIQFTGNSASLRGHIALSKGETLAEKTYVYLVPAQRVRAADPLRFS